jgi:signal transduction histidine kinase/ligand-binding sensor domain-containing protein
MESPPGLVRKVIPRHILLACMLLAGASCAFALDPALDVSQYAHTAWKIRDGFSKGAITSIAQTPDGYLWLGTEFGLVRFNGVRNIPWQPPPNQQLPSNYIFSLLATHDGTLWIGTTKGLASWKDGKLTQYAETAGLTIFKVLEDHEGTVWASGLTITTGKLCAIRSGGVQCYGDDGTLGRGAFNLYEDSKGTLWAGVKNGLWRWNPGPQKFYPLPGEPDGIQALSEDTDGSLLVGWNGGIHRFVNERTEAYPPLSATGKIQGRRMLRDRDGSLWIGTERGLLHVHGGRMDRFSSSNGLSGDDISTLFEDREGSIWVATLDGLDRFRDFAVSTISVNQGLSSSIVTSVLAAKDGSVWLATRNGLNRWSNGQIEIYGGRDGKLNGELPHSLFQDDRDRIWVSTPKSFGYLEKDRFVSVSQVPTGFVTSIAQDRTRNLWVANEHVGLFQLLDGKVVQQTPWSMLGPRGYASTLVADPSQGVWLGFVLGGVAQFIDSQMRASFGDEQGLAEGRVNHLQFDQRGVLWAATDGGLSQIKDGRVATLNSKNGLPCDTVHWSSEDDAGSFWLYTPCGLLRIARSEMDAWASAVEQDKTATPPIHVTVFDNFDGVRNLAAGGHFSPQVTRSADGRLWFLPWDGVSIIDPRHLASNNISPPVHIELITADRTTYDPTTIASGRLQLPALLRDVQIDYTALSLAVPEKVLFRYKLENWDRDWNDAGNRRTAFYNNLPPGTYRFRVIACNNSGVWNETGTFLDFSIAPAYYQTTGFRVSVVAAFLVILAVLYQLRLQQVARQVRARMEERLEERERIARDLHDTLLQSVQGLILKFHAVAKQIPTGEKSAHEALEKALDRADEVLAEGRDRVRNLRGATVSLSDLPEAFKQIAAESPQGRQATFKTVVLGTARKLHPVVLEESYCIGREALINALSHSGGLHVEIEIMYDPRQFRLRVRDDGRGVDPQILQAGGRSDHWGLQGMRERSERIGGQLKIWSRPDTGTEVEPKLRGPSGFVALPASKVSNYENQQCDSDSHRR